MIVAPPNKNTCFGEQAWSKACADRGTAAPLMLLALAGFKAFGNHWGKGFEGWGWGGTTTTSTPIPPPPCPQVSVKGV